MTVAYDTFLLDDKFAFSGEDLGDVFLQGVGVELEGVSIEQRSRALIRARKWLLSQTTHNFLVVGDCCWFSISFDVAFCQPLTSNLHTLFFSF